MLQKTKGIVLNYIRYSESSIIAHMYTDVFGRQSFICSGIKGKKSKNKLVYFQPLSLIEMEVYAKPANEIFRIKEIKYEHPLYNLSEDIKKGVIALFLSELLYKTLHEREPNPALFSFLNSAIQLLDNIQDGVSNFHLVFMIQLSKYLGIFPQADFDDLEGIEYNRGFTSDERFFSGFPDKMRQNLRLINKSSFQNIKDIKLNHSERFELLNSLIEFYKLHYITIGNIKSLPVLQELFSTSI